MFKVVEDELGICPFTLEPCEDCCEQKVLDEHKICPFTLERCIFEAVGDLPSAKN